MSDTPAYLLTLATKYTGYLSRFYDNHKELLANSYEEHYKALMSDSFGSSETWSVGMAARGYRTERLYVNARAIQHQWAVENKLETDDENWQKKVLSAQVGCLKPDIIFINNHTILTPAELRKLRQDNPSVKLVIGWCGIPYKVPDIFHEFDITLSNIPELVEGFKNMGLCAYHVDHSFDPRILEHIDSSRPADVDFSFVGSIVKDTDFHIAREKLILELADKTDIQIWGNMQTATFKDRVRTLILQLAYYAVQLCLMVGIFPAFIKRFSRLNKLANMTSMPNLAKYVSPRLARRARTPVYGLEMFQRLRDSRIVLNTHIDISSKNASNMRLFEATGVGTCLVTDWKENIKDLYEPDFEIAAYRDSKDCIEKVQYLLQNERERQAMAEAGQKRTLKDHTIYHRAEQIDGIIRKHLDLS